MEEIKQHAKSLGFDLIAFCDATLDEKYLGAHEKWIQKSFHADMGYMEEVEKRADLTKILSGAASVIVLATNYYYDQKTLKPGHGRIARYAYGRDYHKIIGKRLKKLEAFIGGDTKSYVDTGPVLERAFAEKAGLGFIGKNSCLITPELGSWVFLSVIITDLKLEPSPSRTLPSCGTCTRCMDACPVGAIIAPGVIDANKCISYHTIENKGEIPPQIANKIAETGRIFGCDICQEVCPHNCRAVPTKISTAIAGDQLSFEKIRSIKSDEEFLELFAGSPLMRTKKEGLQRNVQFYFPT